jgi:predicted transcriptional regulator
VRTADEVEKKKTNGNMAISNAKILGRPMLASRTAHQQSLGPLEIDVMEVLWKAGDSTVREVAGKLRSNHAYTTVMTVLDRLFKKGLLDRRKSSRAFVYSPHLSGQEWERQRTRYLISGLLAGPQSSRKLFLSSVVDAISQHDIILLEQLEKEIRKKRKELSPRS